MEYLIKSCNQYFKKPITEGQIESSFAGLRWLAVEKSQSITSMSRESVLGVINNREGFILTVYGGKLTSYRLLSEKIDDLVTKHNKSFVTSKTKEKNIGFNF